MPMLHYLYRSVYAGGKGKKTFQYFFFCKLKTFQYFFVPLRMNFQLSCVWKKPHLALCTHADDSG